MKFIYVLMLFILLSNLCFSQPPPPIDGYSSNICPVTLVTYISAAGCDQQGWACTGCVDSNGNPVSGPVITGNYADGSAYAKVYWGDFTTGTLGNICGTLNVSILANAQPSLTANGNGLCGSGQITLTANVSSTTNIASYNWRITGSNVSPAAGVTNTTGNTLTLSYTNWTPTTPQVTVAVGSVSSVCNYSTPTAPITGQYAIPYTAWVALNPGTLNSLNNITLNSIPLFCSSATFTASSVPTNATLHWSVGNSNWLSLSPSGNTATVAGINSFYGATSLSVYGSNACGNGSTKITSFHVGRPTAPGPLNVNVDNLCLNQEIGVSSTSDGATSWSWASNNPSDLSVSGGGNGASITPLVITPAGQFWSFSATTTNSCPGTSPTTVWYSAVARCGGGHQNSIVLSPNPAATTLSVQVNDSTLTDQSDKLPQAYNIIVLDRFSRTILKASSSEKIITFPVENIPNDIYYLSVEYKGEIMRKQLMIKK